MINYDVIMISRLTSGFSGTLFDKSVSLSDFWCTICAAGEAVGSSLQEALGGRPWCRIRHPPAGARGTKGGWSEPSDAGQVEQAPWIGKFESSGRCGAERIGHVGQEIADSGASDLVRVLANLDPAALRYHQRAIFSK